MLDHQGVSNLPHRRRNPLTGDWVLVSPHRTSRPWLGQREVASVAERPRHDPTCYLCPGNERAGGQKNPHYDATYVFQNDFTALLPDEVESESEWEGGDELFCKQPVRGTCRVMCFSPRHDLTLADMPTSSLLQVIETWREETLALSRHYQWVQVFENKGAVMGCSNPHPHGQIWATDTLPNEVQKEDATQREFYRKHGEPMLLRYAEKEHACGERVVEENAEWMAIVPYWALWPFEVLLVPRFPCARLTLVSTEQAAALADILKRLLVRYDNLFQTSFPYSMGWHGAPFGEGDWSHWQVHAHFYPPLLRSATVKKFMVGYEMLGEPQRDLTAEEAALRLRACSSIHYKENL